MLRPALLVCCALAPLLLLPPAARAEGQPAPVHVPAIADAATYSAYGQVVGAQELGKFVIDLQADRIYYFDVKRYPLHRDFIFAQLLQTAQTRPAIREYNKNYGRKKPRYILGYLARQLKNDRWDFSFWEGDHIDAAGVRQTRAWLRKSFFVKDPDLRFRPESVEQERLLPELKDLPTVTNDEIYKQVDYQAFNPGRAVGRLRIVPPGAAMDALTFSADEIVVLQESYPDITPVAGIVTATFSTPLSHVNLRARAWRIPNAGYRDAARRFAALDGKQVLLEVRDADLTLREASAEEAAAFQRERAAARKVRVPAPDLTAAELRPLDGLRRADVRAYGAKAANLGEVVTAHLPEVHVPPGFAVPFSAYSGHLARHGIDAELRALLSDRRFGKDAAFRQKGLLALQARITAAPVDPALLDAVEARIAADLGGRSVFVRSSTNAEDLPNFNGAGLYHTAPNVKGREALSVAMKAVWASLWSFRAGEERRLYRIDEGQVACGLLIQASVSATAAGVLVTRNLYVPSAANDYTINAQRGLGLRVVDGRTTPEQVIYDVRFPGTKLISRSDDTTMLVLDDKGGVREVPVPSRDAILTDARARVLAEQVKRIRPLFPFDLDVEWVLEGERFYLVQARAFIGGDAFR